MQYVTFSINSSLFGISIYQVQEFTRLANISPVIGDDKRIAGLVNLRGSIATVLNLKNCLHIEPGPAVSDNRDENESFAKSQKMIILNTDDQMLPEARACGLSSHTEPIVLLVDRIIAVVDVEPEDFFAPPANVTSNFIDGVIKQNEDVYCIISIAELADQIAESNL